MPAQSVQFRGVSQFAHGSVRFGAVESQLTLVTYGGNYQFGQFADRDFLACTYINMAVTNIFITLFVGVFEVYMLHDEDAGICHHTIEDTAIALGDCIYQALGNKRGIERYGYALTMDDCLCQVCLDFGGRPWLVWDAEFNREKIGEMPTEMFLHFFKSLSDAAKMNLNVKAEGQNEHHKIEGIFKALARAIKMAVKRDIYHFELPSSKGVL